jgi:hypothetical protein
MIAIYLNDKKNNRKEKLYNIKDKTKPFEPLTREHFESMQTKDFLTIEKDGEVIYKIGNYKSDNERRYSIEEYRLCISNILDNKKYDIELWKEIYVDHLINTLVKYEVHTTASFVERCTQLCQILWL